MMNTFVSKHTTFILSPVTDILKQSVNSSSGLEYDISTYPLCDYIMQSVFMKMTGFIEQKLKCINWDIATNNFKYRYDMLRGQQKEYSTYTEKNELYKTLTNEIKKLECIKKEEWKNHSCLCNDEKKNIVSDIKKDIEDIFLDSVLWVWANREYLEYNKFCKKKYEKYFAAPTQLFPSISGKNNICLQSIYKDNLYLFRNRIAHNTLSYQQHLPTFDALIKDSYKYNNYFLFFFILVLIDKVFIELYKKYLKVAV